MSAADDRDAGLRSPFDYFDEHVDLFRFQLVWVQTIDHSDVVIWRLPAGGAEKEAEVRAGMNCHIVAVTESKAAIDVIADVNIAINLLTVKGLHGTVQI